MKYTMKELPVTERPYEKYQHGGCAALSDAELLAVILRTGTGGSTSVELAYEVLTAAGNHGLGGLHRISIPELCRIKGIGRVKAIQIKCIAELSRRIAKSAAGESHRLNSARAIAEYYMEDFRYCDQEQVMVLSFNTKGRLLGEQVITRGTVNQSLISPRDIFLEALKQAAVYIVVLHNHPSGDPTPSGEDFEVTRRLSEVGAMLGIPLMDHIVLGHGTYYSFCEHHKAIFINPERNSSENEG